MRLINIPKYRGSAVLLIKNGKIFTAAEKSLIRAISDWRKIIRYRGESVLSGGHRGD